MLNWRELPFVRLLTPFMAGILFSIIFSFNHPVLMGMAVGCFILLAANPRFRGLYRRRWLFGALAYLFLFLVGHQVGHFYDERNRSHYFGEKINEGTETCLIATVSDAPVRKEKWVRLKTKVSAHGPAADSLSECTGNLLLYVARNDRAEGIKYGDRLLLTTRVNEVEPPGNPHSFDYRQYLHFKNIHHQAFVRAGNWQVVGVGFGNPFFAKATELRFSFLATLRKHLPTQNEYAVGSALILGYRDEIPEDVKTAYSQTGAMHVLAVSGLHVGIVFFLLNFFLRRVPLNLTWWRILKMCIVLSGIWGFALVTGLSPSVTRATVMFSCVQIGLAFRRDANIYNTLAASAFLMLLWNPFSLASVSFQLSYLAVFGIVFFQRRFAKLLYVRHPILDKMWQLVCVSLAAQLMLVPLTFFYFHQFPTYFWLSSLLLVPLAGLELGAGLLLLLMEALWPMAALVVGKALWLMLWVGNQFVLLVQNLPGAVVDGIWIGGAVAVLLYLVLTSSIMALASQKMRWAESALALFAVAGVSLAFSSWERGEAQQVVVYDVYKHTAIDVFEGKNVVSLLSANVDEKTLTFATEGHRFAMGMKNLHCISLASNEPHEVGSVFFEKKFLQFGGFRMAIVTSPLVFDVGEKIELDYVLVSGSPKIFIEEIQHVFDFEKIIFDSSNKKWQVEKWKKRCEELGVKYHDVGEEGAFVFDLKK